MKKYPKSRALSRRRFLSSSGLTLAGLGLASLLPGPLARRALAAGPTSDNRFMFIFLRGGNDGLNSLIPHGDSDYSLANRGSAYITPANAIDLNGFASFHPGLADMMDGYNAGEVAAIHQVGYPDHSRSHFNSQRIWENGDPADPFSVYGWLARYLVENGVTTGFEVPVLSVQRREPVILRGPDEYLNVADPDHFDFSLPFLSEPLKSKIIDSWPPQYAELTGGEPYGPVLKATSIELEKFVDNFGAWDQGNWDPKDPDNPTWSLFPVSFATNPDDPSGPGGKKFSSEAYEFFLNLKICALALLESNPGTNNNGTRVAGTELQGFDLHTNMGSVAGRHSELLSWVAYGQRSLRIALSGTAVDPRNYPSVWGKTVVATFSEFGRTSLINGNGGTDHAKASCMWLHGGPVQGGVYNCDAGTWAPGAMFSDSDRYMAVQTDYRSIFWEVLRDHMGADAAMVDTIFPGYTSAELGRQELGLIA